MHPGFMVASPRLTIRRILFVFVMPVALDKLGWRLYMINGGWDVLMVVAVLYYWVETKGKTLEEIDEVIEGRRAEGADASSSKI